MLEHNQNMQIWLLEFIDMCSVCVCVCVYNGGGVFVCVNTI